jgi:Superfamily I DNA and RNA helicases
VRLVEARDEFSEALFVVKEINRMVGGIDMLDSQALAASRKRRAEARGFSDLALLYRTNHQARILEQCLAKEGIPYVVAGREDFLADQPVRQALAFSNFYSTPVTPPPCGYACKAKRAVQPT